MHFLITSKLDDFTPVFAALLCYRIQFKAASFVFKAGLSPACVSTYSLEIIKVWISVSRHHLCCCPASLEWPERPQTNNLSDCFQIWSFGSGWFLCTVSFLGTGLFCFSVAHFGFRRAVEIKFAYLALLTGNAPTDELGRGMSVHLWWGCCPWPYRQVIGFKLVLDFSSRLIHRISDRSGCLSFSRHLLLIHVCLRCSPPPLFTSCCCLLWSSGWF